MNWRLWRALRRAEPPPPCIVCDGPHPSMLCPQVKTGDPKVDAIWMTPEPPMVAPPGLKERIVAAAPSAESDDDAG